MNINSRALAAPQAILLPAACFQGWSTAEAHDPDVADSFIWTVQDIGTTERLNAVAAADNNNVWAVGHGGGGKGQIIRGGRDTGADGSTRYMAEGTTAWGFTSYVCVQNPNASPVDATLTYMTGEGPKFHPEDPIKMPASSRKTIRVNDVLPNTDFSTMARGSEPIIAERAMYWNSRGAGTNTIGKAVATPIFQSDVQDGSAS